jgi:hypothetical protein
MLGTFFVLTPAAGQPWKETILHNFTAPTDNIPNQP